jgi:hypothetical protein
MEIGAEKEFIGQDCLIELQELEINIIHYCEEQAPVGHEVFTCRSCAKGLQDVGQNPTSL